MNNFKNSDKRNISYYSKQEYAYAVIREQIVTGEKLPGERLVISTLAKELGFSEIPIREALKKLEAEGYVTTTSSGMVVTTVSPEEHADLLEIRVELEGIAIRRAALRIDSEGLAELKRLQEAMTRAIAKHDISEFSSLDKEFHYLIYTYCGVEFLKKIILDAWSHSERGRAIFRLAPWRTESSLKEHQEIINALEARDGLKAESLLKAHRQKAFNLYIEQLRSHNFQS